MSNPAMPSEIETNTAALKYRDDYVSKASPYTAFDGFLAGVEWLKSRLAEPKTQEQKPIDALARAEVADNGRSRKEFLKLAMDYKPPAQPEPKPGEDERTEDDEIESIATNLAHRGVKCDFHAGYRAAEQALTAPLREEMIEWLNKINRVYGDKVNLTRDPEEDQDSWDTLGVHLRNKLNELLEDGYRAAQAKADETIRELRKALREVRAAIVQNATDTLWMPQEISPSATAVEWINAALEDSK